MLNAKSMDDSSTIEETELNFEFEEVLEALNEMHEEAQRLNFRTPNKKTHSSIFSFYPNHLVHFV